MKFWKKQMSNITQHFASKRKFDVTNSNDMSEFVYFGINNNWKTTCPFILEWPYNNIVDMIKDKIVSHYFLKQEKDQKYNFDELYSVTRNKLGETN